MFDGFAMVMEMHAELLHCMYKHCTPSDIIGLAMRHHMCHISPGRPSAASTQAVICLYPAGCCIGSKRSPVGLNELLGEPVVEGLQQVGPQAGAGAARNGVAQHKALQAVTVARLPICARQAFSLCVSSLQVFWDSCPAPTPQLVVHAMNWRSAKCVHDAAASAVRPACSPFRAALSICQDCSCMSLLHGKVMLV